MYHSYVCMFHSFVSDLLVLYQLVSFMSALGVKYIIDEVNSIFIEINICICIVFVSIVVSVAMVMSSIIDNACNDYIHYNIKYFLHI